MKTKAKGGCYSTTSTELASALRALSVSLLGEDLPEGTPEEKIPDSIVRIFDETHPCNPHVSHGLKRGGQIQYTFKTESDQFDAGPGDLAKAYGDPKPSPKFDTLLAELREKAKKTELAPLVGELIKEYPLEIMRYIRAAFHFRRLYIDLIAKQEDITELVRVKDGGHAIVHHRDMPADQVQKLWEA